MPSEPPTETGSNGEPTDPAIGEPEEVADNAAESDGEDDRSYEQQVVDELVPDISIGDDATPDSHEIDAEPDNDATPDSHEIDAEPDNDAEADAEDELSDALEEIDDDLLNAFIKIVVSIKAGILLISIGLLVIGFREMLALGGGLIAVGCLALARAAYRYWNHKQMRQQRDDE